MTLRPRGKLSLNDPITLQLFHNFISGLIPPDISHFNFLLRIHTDEDISNSKIMFIVFELLRDKMAGQIRSVVSSTIQLLLRTGTLEINPVQMKIFFLQLRCYMEHAITIMHGEETTKLCDSHYYSSVINGITVVTEKFVNQLKTMKKDHLKIGNDVERWIKVGLTCEITVSLILVSWKINKLSTLSLMPWLEDLFRT